MRLSSIWSQPPWKRKKDDVEHDGNNRRKSRSLFKTASSSQLSQYVNPDNTATKVPTSDYKARRISLGRAKKSDNSTSEATRPVSRGQKRQSLLWNNEERQAMYIRSEDGVLRRADQDESFLKKLRRKSQNFTLPRPSTSSGLPSKRRSFFGGTADNGDTPALPTIPQGSERRALPRHVPITIDHLQQEYHQSNPDPGPGMAITSNDVQRASTMATTRRPNFDKPNSRPVSMNGSFSIPHLQANRTKLSGQTKDEFEDSSSGDDDILTALPALEFKDVSPIELSMAMTNAYSPKTYSPPHSQPDRHSFRTSHKVLDIISPRPMSMFAAPPKRPTSSSNRNSRVKSVIQPTMTTPIGPLEDGPKGDWTRTRNSWLVDVNDGSGSEQIEWDRLKQFMEAYGSGKDATVVSVDRPSDGSEDSSSFGGENVRHARKHSNAQALAALEFGLT